MCTSIGWGSIETPPSTISALSIPKHSGNLWLYGNTPAPLRNAVMRTPWFAQLSDKDMDLLREGRLLPASAPVTSYLGFEKMMAEEERLSASGRYTVIHVLVPHAPHRLTADCDYTLGSTATGPMEQTHCALKMIREFITLIENLDRFDDSLILIQGDHGGPYRTTGRYVADGNAGGHRASRPVFECGVARETGREAACR